jgi:glycosyltransferase involved in cell wall biosynthesis
MNRRIPIAAITQSLNVGGSTTFLLNLGTALGARGETLRVICLSETNEMAADFTAANIPVVCVNRQRLIYEDRTEFVYHQLRSIQPRSVLACLGVESFEILRVVPDGVVRLGIIQSDDPGPYTVVDPYRPYLDAMIGVSSIIRDKLVANCGFKHSVYIPYGIQFRPFVARKPRAAGDPVRIIYVGRMIECQKRVSRLVELAKNLAAQGVSFRFTFVGGGEDLEKTRLALADLKQVQILGDVPNQKVTDLLRSNDVFVLLSDFEGLPLSLLEAMGEGLVPVVSDLESGVREVVTEATGRRVPVGDVRAAASAIVALANNRARWEELSANCVRMAREEYSASRMADRFLDLVASFPNLSPAWPSKASIPAPLALRPTWMFKGLPRMIRRRIKGWRNA